MTNLFTRAAICGLLALSLAGCGSVGALTYAKTIDSVCAAEPAVYASYVTVAVARNASPKRLATAAAAHAIATDICLNRPADLVQGAAALTAAYATIISARAELSRS